MNAPTYTCGTRIPVHTTTVIRMSGPVRFDRHHSNAADGVGFVVGCSAVYPLIVVSLGEAFFWDGPALAVGVGGILVPK